MSIMSKHQIALKFFERYLLGGIMKIYYKVYHFYFRKTKDHFNLKSIGIYDTKSKAVNAINEVKVKSGFMDYPEKFHIIKTVRFRLPKFLNKTFWNDGFVVYTN